MPPRELRIAQPPAQPDALSVPLGGDVEQAHLEIPERDAKLVELGEQRTHSVPDRGDLALMPGALPGVAGAAVPAQVGVEGGMGHLELPLLHRERNERGAQPRDEGPCLLERIEPIRCGRHGGLMVAGVC